MLTTTSFTTEQLLDLVAAIYEYNRRGPVQTLTFCDPQGQQLPVAWINVVSEEKGLAVRLTPEDIEQRLTEEAAELDRILNPGVNRG